MSSYTLQGDDILLGGFWSKVVKASPLYATGKFLLHPVKESKAAIKTIARFDPTSKTAKYGNVTKGALAIGAAVGATILTAGAAGPGAFALASAAIPGATKMITPVRKPPKGIASTANNLLSSVSGISNPSMPLNTFMEKPQSTSTPPDTTSISSYDTTVKPDSKLPITIIGLGVAALGAVILMQSKKKSLSQGV